ncbi:MAG: hypothetical protein JXB38_21180 [Anaerolineales bacterium]|nr:hypothetical protein [Anaerolineales bacterium]
MTRAKWRLPSEKELKSHLRNSHREAIGERLERYKYIWQEFGPPMGMILIGGISASLALEELRLCYIDGYYLACVLLAQIFIENSLGGLYIMAGDERTAEKGFAQLIDKALMDNLIDPLLANHFHELRRMRNTYVHPNAGLDKRTVMGRMLEKYEDGKTFESPKDFAEEDARQAIEILVDFLRYSSRQGEHPWEPPRD